MNNYTRPDGRRAVATVGTFDGIHRGHQQLLARLREVAIETGAEPVLITFHPHPRVVISPDNIPPLLTTLEEKKRFIPDFHSGTVLVIRFDEYIENLSARQFVKDILVEQVGVEHLIAGHDHTIGKDRRGDTAELVRLGAEFGFDVEVVTPVLHDNEPVSSSSIRSAMLSGDYEKAVDLLGHDYAIYGQVERGLGLGRRLGYPTANVRYDLRKLLPAEGVYSCWSEIEGKSYYGMMFIGQNHFNPQARITVEVNLFDYDEDIYDRFITVYPIQYIRSSERYDSTDLLVKQLSLDEQIVRALYDEEKDNDSNKRAQGSNCCGQSTA